MPLFYEDYPILLTLREGLVTCLPKKALKMYALTEPNCDRRNVCYTETLGKECCLHPAATFVGFRSLEIRVLDHDYVPKDRLDGMDLSMANM